MLSIYNLRQTFPEAEQVMGQIIETHYELIKKATSVFVKKDQNQDLRINEEALQAVVRYSLLLELLNQKQVLGKKELTHFFVEL